MKHWWIIIIAVVVYGASVWTRPLFSPGESDRLLAAYELVSGVALEQITSETSDSPPVEHWLNAAGVELFGFRAGAVRIMPALFTLLSAWMIFFLVRRAQDKDNEENDEKDHELPYYCALWYLVTGLVFVTGTYGSLDAILAFFAVAAVCFFFYFCIEKDLFKRLGLLAFCGIAVWGAISIGGAAKSVSPLFSIAVLPAVLLPGVIMIGGAIIGFRKINSGAFKSRLIRLSIAFLIVALAIFLATCGQTVAYALVCCAGIAVFFGSAVNQYLKDDGEKAWNIPLRVLAWLLAIVAAVIFITQSLALFWRKFPSEFALYARDDQAWMIVILALASAATAWNISAREKNKNNKFYLFFIGSAILMLPMSFALPTRFFNQVTPTSYIEKYVIPKLTPETILVTTPSLRSSACFVLQCADIPVAGASNIQSLVRHYDAESFKELIKSGVPVVLLVDNMDELTDYPTPEAKTGFQNTRFIILEYNTPAHAKIFFEFKGL